MDNPGMRAEQRGQKRSNAKRPIGWRSWACLSRTISQPTTTAKATRSVGRSAGITTSGADDSQPCVLARSPTLEPALAPARPWGSPRNPWAWPRPTRPPFYARHLRAILAAGDRSAPLSCCRRRFMLASQREPAERDEPLKRPMPTRHFLAQPPRRQAVERPFPRSPILKHIPGKSRVFVDTVASHDLAPCRSLWEQTHPKG